MLLAVGVGDHGHGDVRVPALSSLRYIYLPCLGDKMRASGATNVALAKVAGCTDRTINRARQCLPVQRFLGLSIMEALNRGGFTRDNRGKR